MALRLKDIIDLDYLLNLDEQAMEPDKRGRRPQEESPEQIQARDRDIFCQTGGDQMTENRLLADWLEYRRLIFFDRSGPVRLPGKIFERACQWAGQMLFIAGAVMGLVLVYTFLAYHGTRPVNVTLFFAVFILLPFILSLAAALLSAFRGPGSMGQSLAAALVFKGIPRLAPKIGRFLPQWEARAGRLEYLTALASRKRKEYGSLFFWSFFVLSSVGAAGFSAGALCGTLFRVVVTDMAFGWQSTLMAGSSHVAGLVQKIALPWSWLVPGAVPESEQIQGSRIILKQGIESLATQDLVAWWPFLCMGMLVYALLPRLVLILGGKMAQVRAAAQFDFKRPRFRKLLIRMQTPVMDIDFSESGGQDQAVPESREPEYGALERPRAAGKPKSAPVSGQCMVLVPSSVYDDKLVESLVPSIEGQLFLNIGKRVGISMDFERDRALLESNPGDLPDQVVLLQEAWQPPIRERLHYMARLKEQVLVNGALWVLLTRTPDQAVRAVPGDDPDYQIWKQAVAKLHVPGIAVERFSGRIEDEG